MSDNTGDRLRRLMEDYKKSNEDRDSVPTDLDSNVNGEYRNLTYVTRGTKK